MLSLYKLLKVYKYSVYNISNGYYRVQYSHVVYIYVIAVQIA